MLIWVVVLCGFGSLLGTDLHDKKQTLKQIAKQKRMSNTDKRFCVLFLADFY